VQIATTAATTTNFTINNLAQGTPYYFQIQAFNGTNAALSAVLTATTKAVSITPPTNLKAQVLNGTTIQLNWTDAQGETGYYVYRWDGVAPSGTLVATLGANTTSFQNTGQWPANISGPWLITLSAVPTTTATANERLRALPVRVRFAASRASMWWLIDRSGMSAMRGKRISAPIP
jgi:hypothetical protein